MFRGYFWGGQAARPGADRAEAGGGPRFGNGQCVLILPMRAGRCRGSFHTCRPPRPTDAIVVPCWRRSKSNIRTVRSLQSAVRSTDVRMSKRDECGVHQDMRESKTFQTLRHLMDDRSTVKLPPAVFPTLRRPPKANSTPLEATPLRSARSSSATADSYFARKLRYAKNEGFAANLPSCPAAPAPLTVVFLPKRVYEIIFVHQSDRAMLSSSRKRFAVARATGVKSNLDHLIRASSPVHETVLVQGT